MRQGVTHSPSRRATGVTSQSLRPVSGRAPRVKARHLKTFLELAAAHAAGERILRGVSTEVRHRIAHASAIDWLPIELDLILTEAVVDALSPQAARSFFHDLTVADLERPLLKPLVSSSVALYGQDPGGLVRQFPLAWVQLVDSCGEVSVLEHPEGGVLIVFEGLSPALLRRERVWLQAVCASLSALLTVSGKAGAVELTALDLGRRRAEVRFTW